jgi:hypothetical protein
LPQYLPDTRGESAPPDLVKTAFQGSTWPFTRTF